MPTTRACSLPMWCGAAATMRRRSATPWRQRRISSASPAASPSTRPIRTSRWTRSTTWRPSRISPGRRSPGTDRAVTTVVLQQALNGIVLGSLYVLVALGLTLIYGVLVQINFAHADIVTIGAFAAYFFTFALGGNYFVGIGVALLVGAVLGWLVNATIFAPLRERGSELLPLIATIGVSILLQNVMLLAFGPIPYPFDSPYSNRVIRFWGGTFITWQSLIVIVVSTLTIALLYAFMKFTFMGKALRAVAQ